MFLECRIFFSKKVTLIIGVFPSVNFPQEKYFSPRNQISLLSYKVMLRDLVNRPTPSSRDWLQSWLRCMLLMFSLFNTSHPSSKFGARIRIFSFSQNVFCPFRNKFQFLSHIYFVVCKSFQFGPV